jgi:hypothetical protein
VSSFWDVLRVMFEAFVFVAYLILVFHIVADLFRDPTVGGGTKAVWVFCLVVLPLLTGLLYVILRGGGMAERQRGAQNLVKSETDTYIRSVAGKSPVQQIADAKALLDAGAVTRDEFARLKANALA